MKYLRYLKENKTLQLILYQTFIIRLNIIVDDQCATISIYKYINPNIRI